MRLRWLCLLVGLLSVAQLATAAPTVDAGPAKTVNLPCSTCPIELTLFGHVTDTLAWTASWSYTGPSGAVFSASWSPVTSVTFVNTGTYTFTLSANDGGSPVTASATITVNPASAQTAFYVLPTSTAGSPAGTATHPWTSLLDNDADYGTKWSTIMTALATSDVIVYLAGVAPDGVTQEVLSPTAAGSGLVINRACISGGYCTSGADTTQPHHLTIDGMSLYSTSNSAPVWVPNPTTTRLQVSCVAGCNMALGWGDSQMRSHITVRGIEVSGLGNANANARTILMGSFLTFEYIYMHDIGGPDGPTMLLDTAVLGTCVFQGDGHDITLRHNHIVNGFGEGIYLGGNYNFAADGGCVTGPNSGDNNFDILVENNTLTDTGSGGGQGDGIDIKSGVYNVTVRLNDVGPTHAIFASPCYGGDGIVSVAKMPNSTHDSNYVIENNRLHDGGCAASGGESNGMSLSDLGVLVVRNNVITNFPGRGIILWNRDVSTPRNYTTRFYHNTIAKSGQEGINTTFLSDTPVLRNNLMMGNTGGSLNSDTTPDSDYNVLSSASLVTEGSHSVVHASTSDVVVNYAGNDFHLVSTSVAKDAGVNLGTLSNVGAAVEAVAVDVASVSRPQGSGYDVGAYEFVTGAAVSAQVRVIR
jgi:hypothetical protein